MYLPCRSAIPSTPTLQASNTQECAYPAGQLYSGVLLPCRPAILRKVLNLQASNTQKCAYPSGQQYSEVHLPFRPAILRREATLQARNAKCGYPAGWQCSNSANALQISSTQSAAALFVLASNTEQKLPCRPAILSKAALQTSNTKCSYNAIQKYWMQLPCRPAILNTVTCWPAILSAVTLQASSTITKCSYPADQQYWVQLP